MEVQAQKITPFLWFNGNVEEAVNFYMSVFKDGKIINMNRMPGQGPGESGKVFMAVFTLNGQEFMALDGGPMFKFTEAISFYVRCNGQAEVDDLWNKLTADGGQESQCGWLKDKFGLSWQIIPEELPKLLYNPDPAKAGKVMQAMMKMKKIVVKELEDAAV